MAIEAAIAVAHNTVVLGIGIANKKTGRDKERVEVRPAGGKRNEQRLEGGWPLLSQ